MSLDDDDDRDAITKWEENRAAGFRKIAGKHVKVDGLVAKSGRRRILSEPPPDPLVTLWRAEKIRKRLPDILHARSATVFEALFLNPLLGAPKRSAADLALQFGVPVARIYRVLHGAKRRVAEAICAEQEAERAASRRALEQIDSRGASPCPRQNVCCLALHPNGAYGDEKCRCLRPWLALLERPQHRLGYHSRETAHAI
ncbi:MAG: hypothetical protein AB7E84_05395 [Xanthobacteraceae bacterium]